MLLLRRLSSKHLNGIKMQISGAIIMIAEMLSFGHRAEGLGPAALAIIPALITSGGSFLGSTLPAALSGDSIIKLNITVENWTRFPMTNPSIYCVQTVVRLTCSHETSSLGQRKSWLLGKRGSLQQDHTVPSLGCWMSMVNDKELW